MAPCFPKHALPDTASLPNLLYALAPNLLVSDPRGRWSSTPGAALTSASPRSPRLRWRTRHQQLQPKQV